MVVNLRIGCEDLWGDEVWKSVGECGGGLSGVCKMVG